jgi:predicted CoA-binding protein
MNETATTLVIGASENPERYSNIAIRMLREYGHPVKAVGLKKGTVADVSIESEKPEMTNVDTVTLYIGPQHQASWETYLLEHKPRRIIFNPGTENPEFEEKARQQGIETLEACTLVLLRTGQY